MGKFPGRRDSNERCWSVALNWGRVKCDRSTWRFKAVDKQTTILEDTVCKLSFFERFVRGAAKEPVCVLCVVCVRGSGEEGLAFATIG